MSKCYYCQTKTGFFSKLCQDCDQLVATFKVLQQKPTFGYVELLDTLLATGVAPERVQVFLDADPDGTGSLNDKVTAKMTNEVMAGLGTPSYMTGPDVKKVRADIAAGKSLLEVPDVVAPEPEKE